MKTYTFTIIILLIITSCSGFLDEIDQDRFVPSDVDHYSALLLETFTRNTNSYYNTQFMSDEIHQTKTTEWIQGVGIEIKNIYTWQKYIDLSSGGTVLKNNDAWKDYYEKIAVCNYVIEEIDNASGSEKDRNRVKGEAFFMRSYCYLCLTNLYAEPYENEDQSKRTYGVPSRTNIGVETIYYRSMLNVNYEVIENDIKEAIHLLNLGSPPPSIHHPGTDAGKLLASRIFLYKKNYNETIKYATEVIENNNLNRFNSTTPNSVFIHRNNPEILYSFGYDKSCIDYENFKTSGFEVNPELLESYDILDLRPSVYFDYISDVLVEGLKVINKKNNLSFTNLGFVNIRTAEAWLNRAEAYAFSGEIDKAIEDLTYLLSYRYSDIKSLKIPTNQDELIDYIFQERFKEFCFEEQHRWFDLRRMGPERRPIIIHKYTTVDENKVISTIEEYTLLKEDRNYTLNIPIEEKNRNPLIRDYDRYDKLPYRTY